MQSSICVFLVPVLLLTACENRVDPPVRTDVTSQVNNSKEMKRVAVKASQARPQFMNAQPFEIGGQCNMENLNGSPWNSVVTVNATSSLTISGWGVDAKAKKAPAQFYLRMQDQSGKEYYAEASEIDRQDVVDYFKENFYLKSGYKVEIDTQEMSDAAYDVMIVMSVDGKSILCSSGRKFIKN